MALVAMLTAMAEFPCLLFLCLGEHNGQPRRKSVKRPPQEHTPNAEGVLPVIRLPGRTAALRNRLHLCPRRETPVAVWGQVLLPTVSW